MVRRLPVIVLALMALVNLGRGAVHVFAPDGGAHSIAGLDLTQGGQAIMAFLATIGVGQIVKGAAEAWVVLRRRDLVTIFLVIQFADTVLAMISLYLWRPLPVTVPGQSFNLALAALQAVAVAIALREPRR
jgi:hypothetical protein